MLRIILLLSFVTSIPSAFADRDKATAFMEKVFATYESMDRVLLSSRYVFTDQQGKTETWVVKSLMDDSGNVRCDIATPNEPVAGFIRKGQNLTEWNSRAKRWTSRTLTPKDLLDSRTFVLMKKDGLPRCAQLAGETVVSWTQTPSPRRVSVGNLFRAQEVSLSSGTVDGKAATIFAAKGSQNEGGFKVTEAYTACFDPNTALPLRTEVTADIEYPAMKPQRVASHVCVYEQVLVNPAFTDGMFEFDLAAAGYQYVAPEELAVVSPLLGKKVSELRIDGYTWNANRFQKGGLLITWATWCVPCKTLLTTLATESWARDLDILAVNVDENDAAYQKHVIDKNPKQDNLRDSAFPERVNVLGIPTIAIFDAAGVIKWTQTGWGGAESTEALRAAIKSHLGPEK